MQTRQTHWASLLTLSVLGISTLFLLLFITVLVFGSIIDLFEGRADPAAGMISAVSFGFILILLLLCVWFVLQKTRGLEQADLPFRFPFAAWQWVAVPAMVVTSLLLGGLVSLAGPPVLNWIILPLLTVLVIVPPIWLMFGVAAKGIDLGPRWRFFTILGLGMTIAPFIMIVLEITVLFAVIIAGSVYIAFTQPALLNEMEALAGLINEGLNEEALLSMLAPYLTNPYVIGTVLGYIALFVPLIEELLKPLAVWLFARQIESPAQGFALGAISGAAFALIESLNASADGSTSWAIIVGARTGTSVLHMFTSGMVGWGIVSIFKERRIGRLMACYVAAVLIHGVWNAAAVGAGLSVMGESVGKPEWYFSFAPAMICGLTVLGLGVAALLFRFNNKLRAHPASTHPEEVKVESAA